MLFTRLFCAVMVIAIGVGCAPKTTFDVPKLSAARPGTAKVIERKVRKADFIAALDRPGSLQDLRLVAVYRREGGVLPEYRLFGVDRKGPYAVLGLETADILLAANDYVLYEPEKFKTYVSLLRNEQSARIDIARSGERLTLAITFE